MIVDCLRTIRDRHMVATNASASDEADGYNCGSLGILTLAGVRSTGEAYWLTAPHRAVLSGRMWHALRSANHCWQEYKYSTQYIYNTFLLVFFCIQQQSTLL